MFVRCLLIIMDMTGLFVNILLNYLDNLVGEQVLKLSIVIVCMHNCDYSFILFSSPVLE